MANGTRTAKAGHGETRPSKDLRRRLRRTERQLAGAREREARRARQLAKAQALIGDLEQRLTVLRATDGTHGVPNQDPVASAPHAYCMREKRTVVIADPVAIVLRNGRAAVSGTCPDCGVHVVATARAATAAAHEPPTAPPV